jgi:5-methyltetrahydrofolate--homocysteine methyltransferase
MFAENELEAAVRGVTRAGLGYVATMTFDTGGRTMMGLRPQDAMHNSRLLPQKPIAFGANCGIGPAQLLDSVIGFASAWREGDIVVAKSNCGLPVMGDDMRVTYNGTPKVMAAYARLARDSGARIIGGCCGTTAAHLRAMVQELRSTKKGNAPSYEAIESELGKIRKRTTNWSSASFTEHQYN